MRHASEALAGGASLRVRGGPGSLTQAMSAAAIAAGAEIRTGQLVEQILVRDERVTGVVAGGREIAADMVISAVDPKTTFLQLIDPVELTPDLTAKMRNYRARGTVAKINLALSALPSFRGIDDSNWLAGRIHIGPSLDYLERAFDHAKYGELSREPWLELVMPSVLDPTLAPAGKHVASIYVHYAPHTLRESQWTVAKGSLLPAVLEILERYAPGIAAQVVASQVITPAELESDHGFAGGHNFHGELAIDQLFAMRPLLGHARYESPIRGLYLCGGGTHPGGFMTGASGRLAARQIIDHRS
jgi:phytoene dehydrogenase-like protein